MMETIFASLGAAVCLVLLVHMFLPPARKARVDAMARGAWRAAQGPFKRRRSGMPKPIRRSEQKAANKPRMNPAQAQREAEREAQDVIDRVRRQARADPGVEREGNVYRPDAFKPRPPGDKLQ